MKLIKCLAVLCGLFVVSLTTYAQNVIQAPIRVDDFKNNFFSNKNNIQCDIPISQSESIQLSWKEKETSFTNKGVRTFIGYDGNKLVATLSFTNESILGTLFSESGETTITEHNGYIALIKDPATPICSTEAGSHKQLNNTNLTKTLQKVIAETSEPTIKNDDVLRIYRLAILVDYSVFSSWKIDNKKDNVLAFWAEIELSLNQMYIRDLGVKFELVTDDELIRNKQEKEVFAVNPRTGKRYENTYFTDYGTQKLNELIGENGYDLGVILTSSANGGGLSTLDGGYKKRTKGASTANTPSLQIIAHEIGHLFGGRHTFSNSYEKAIGYQTEQTELGRGFSVMSYGHPRDFFSLSSIEFIRNRLVNKPYYKDKGNKNSVKGYYTEESNIPYGIEIENQAPKIDKKLIKPAYNLPRATSFQFYIQATDADQDELSYCAQQRDVVIHTGLPSPSKTRFFTKPGNKNNNIEFKPEYTSSGLFYTVTDFNSTGICTFWLSASDSKPITEQQITKYDLVETKINFIEGTPFRITSEDKKTYQAGEKVMLTWDVDENIFNNTKVRILMSDDFGETYKYTLVASADNNGHCEVTIPPISLGEKIHTDRYGNPISKSGKGLFKIEVIDHVAFSLSNYNPVSGRFTIENNKISLYNLPANEVTVIGTIPEAADVKGTTTCANSEVKIELTETKDDNLITRTWTATDDCDNTATFTQRIHVKKTSPTVPTNTEYQTSTTALYPNPVKNSFTLSGFSQIAKVSVFNSLGKRVKVFTQEQQREYNIGELNEGNYIVVVLLSDNTEKSFKIIKVNP